MESIALKAAANYESSEGTKKNGAGMPGGQGNLGVNFDLLLQQVSTQIQTDVAAITPDSGLSDIPRQVENPGSTDGQDLSRGEDAPQDRFADRDSGQDRGESRSDAHRVDRGDDTPRDGATDRDDFSNRPEASERTGEDARRDDTSRDQDRGRTDSQLRENARTSDPHARNDDGSRNQQAGTDPNAGQATGNQAASDGAATIVAGQQHAEQVLSSLVGATSTAANQGPAQAQNKTDAATPGRENAVEGLTKAADSVVKPNANAGGGRNAFSNGQQGQHGQAQNQGQANAQSQANANAAAQAQNQAHSQGQAGNASDDAAARQAQALSRMVGDGNKVKVEVNVTRESATLVSQPGSALSSAAATAAEEGGPTLRQQQAANTPNALGPNPAAQQAAQQAAAAGGQVQGQQAAGQNGQAQVMAAAGADAKGAVQGPAHGNSGMQATQPGGGESTPTAGANASGETSQSQQAAATRAAQQPRAATHSQPLVDQVSVQITKALALGKDRINIQLKPAELGRVEVQMEIAADGRIQAVVQADTRETLDMLRRDVGELTKALQDAGFDTHNSDLSFNLRGQQGEDDLPKGFGGRGGSDAADGEVPEKGFSDPVLSGQVVGGITADGRVDIRA